MPAASTDRIEKQIRLEAPLSRVWKAISDPVEFGAWFCVELEGRFAPGETVVATVGYVPGYEGVKFEMYVERVEPEKLFSYRWHPHDASVEGDLTGEPTTLVEFKLESVGSATQLTIIESGFDSLPEGLRADSFPRNEHGWTQQVENVRKHVSAGQ